MEADRARREPDQPRIELAPGSFISVTFIRLIDQTKIPQFLQQVQAARKQVAQVSGILHYDVHRIDSRRYLTRTAWESEGRMRAFRDSGDHAEAMRQTPTLADLTFSTHWIGDSIPSWTEATRRLATAIAQRKPKT